MRKKIKVFCFPYAGASASLYFPWKALIPEQIELMPMELAGRGERLDEPHYCNFNQAVEDMYRRILPHINTPYILFGHCMGAVLCYELVVKIQYHQNPLPEHIIFSGQTPPQYRNGFAKLYKLNDEDLIQSIRAFGADPEGKLYEKDVADFFLTILKADCKIFDEYISSGKLKIPCDITILYGKNDPLNNMTDMVKWKEYASKNIDMIPFTGNHFFINRESQKIIAIIHSIVRKLMEQN